MKSERIHEQSGLDDSTLENQQRLASAYGGQPGLPSPFFRRLCVLQGQQTWRKRREWPNPQQMRRSKVDNRFRISDLGFRTGWVALRQRKRSFRVRDFSHESFTGPFIRKILVPVTRIWFDTCRVTLLNERVYRQYFLSDKPIIGGTWHRAAIYFLYFFEKFRPMIMISRSKDGEILAQYAAGFGVVPARGSTHKGGSDAVKQMQRYLSGGGKACATVLDGPRGPAYVAKKGMIHLAKLTGAPLIPLIWSADRVFTLRDSWDKTVLPLPWSRVCIAFGDPIIVPADSSSQELNHYRKLVQDRLNRMTVEVDRLCGYR